MYKDIALVTVIVAALAISSHIVLSLKDQHKILDKEAEVRGLWSAWKVQFDRTYSTELEDAERFIIFAKNYEFIQEWNAGNNTSILGLNVFADLTNEEFKALMVGEPVTEESAPQAVCPTLNVSNLNTTFDWRTLNMVSNVYNQGYYHSCWSFSTAEVLESLFAITTGKLPVGGFSEQQLIDCDNQCAGCGFDRPDLALVYTAAAGIMYSTDYPYYGSQSTCKYNATKAVKVNSAEKCVPKNNATQLMYAVSQRPVSTGIQGNQAAFQFYYGGVITATSGCGDQVDHFPITVGWGNYQGTDVWYVRNSWGTGWGIGGYAYIARDPSANGGAGVCGILKQAVYPITQSEVESGIFA